MVPARRAGTIKNFIKEYNDLIKEMDTKYNADKATDYTDFTDLFNIRRSATKWASSS